MNKMVYTPINYDSWNFEGKGVNILHLLSPIELKIWNSAFPFQDKRDDKGHAEFVTYFALNLLKQIKAERGIVIPAAILHDIGWSQLPRTEIERFYLPNWRDYELELRKRHQEEGIKVAERILTFQEYPKEFTSEILSVISQHDTRKGFYSPEDGVVRDADKLWQFTLPHWEIFLTIRNFSPEDLYRLLKDRISTTTLYSRISPKIAELELENTVTSFKKT